MKEELTQYITDLIKDLAVTDSQVALLAMLLVAVTIVLDSISMFARKQRRSSGMETDTKTFITSETNNLPIKNYVSDLQGLAGRPDALLCEDGHIIPVERKPLAKKIRDRYVAQLLVYMRLVEEFEGKRPPYGYLILGANCRRVKIYNTEKRQAWLQKNIDEMQAILEDGAQSVASPHPKKCQRCSVRNACQHRIDVQPATHLKSTPASLQVISDEAMAANDGS